MRMALDQDPDQRRCQVNHSENHSARMISPTVGRANVREQSLARLFIRRRFDMGTRNMISAIQRMSQH